MPIDKKKKLTLRMAYSGVAKAKTAGGSSVPKTNAAYNKKSGGELGTDMIKMHANSHTAWPEFLPGTDNSKAWRPKPAATPNPGPMPSAKDAGLKEMEFGIREMKKKKKGPSY